MDSAYSKIALFLTLLTPTLLLQTLAIDCDHLKFAMKHPRSPDYCIDCKICPDGEAFKESEKPYLIKSECKKKNEEVIAGQGFAWCTETEGKSPACPDLRIRHGKPKCSLGNDVYSECTVNCNPGYKPLHQQEPKAKCLETLQWNISESELQCERSVPPDKPEIKSSSYKDKVLSGSDLTLTCVTTSEPKGKWKTSWFFSGEQLKADPDRHQYLIHRVQKSQEGHYYCQIEDEIGHSDVSAEYALEVEEQSKSDDSKHTLVIWIVLAAFACVTVFSMIIYCQVKKGFPRCVASRDVERQDEANERDSCAFSSKDTLDTTLDTLDEVPLKEGHRQGNISEGKRRDSDTPSERVTLLKSETRLPFTAQNIRTEKETFCTSSTNNLEPALDSENENSDECNFSLDSKPDASRNDKVGAAVMDSVQDTVKALRNLTKDTEMMKKLITILDQHSDPSHDKPTFRDLGKNILKMDVDQVEHLHKSRPGQNAKVIPTKQLPPPGENALFQKYECAQRKESTTERILLLMTHHRKDIFELTSELNNFPHTEKLSQEIQEKFVGDVNAEEGGKKNQL